MKRRVTIHDVKQALLDERFRAMLPEDLLPEVQSFIKNPGCACNHPLYMKVMKKCAKQVASYFPAKETPEPEEFEREVEKLSKNEWQVINCTIHQLTEELRRLGPGRKQVEVARWEDQVTVIVNHIEGIY